MTVQNRPSQQPIIRPSTTTTTTTTQPGITTLGPIRPGENARAGQVVPAGTQYVPAGSGAFQESRAGAQAAANNATGAQGAAARRDAARGAELQGFNNQSGPILTGYSRTVADGIRPGQTVGSYLSAEATRAADPNRGVRDGTITAIRPGDRPPGVYSRNNYSDLRIDRAAPFTQQSRMYFVSGITSPADMRVNDGLVLANMTGKPVNIVHNNTNGMLPDSAETAMQVMGGRSNAPTDSMARALTQDLSNLMNNRPLAGGDRNLTITAHSQGGVIATHALSQSIQNLRNDRLPSGQRRWSDEQIRSVVSERVQLNLLGSPANVRNTNARTGQPIAFVPPTLRPAVDEKPLSWFFGGPTNVASIRTEVNPPAAIPPGPGINNLHHQRDPVPMNLQDTGRDDAAMFQQLQRGMTREVRNPLDAAANVADVSGAMARIHGVLGSDILGAVRDLRHTSFHELTGANREGQFDRQRYNNGYFGRSRPIFTAS